MNVWSPVLTCLCLHIFYFKVKGEFSQKKSAIFSPSDREVLIVIIFIKWDILTIAPESYSTFSVGLGVQIYHKSNIFSDKYDQRVKTDICC